jgi:anti-sigma28 factor (negative regulator of flagellin synthesis)
MRIEANRPATEAADATRNEGTVRRGGKEGGAVVDRVEIAASTAVQERVQSIVSEAVSRAAEPPEARPEAIARAKRLIAEGTLGRDSVALASALLDELLDRP